MIYLLMQNAKIGKGNQGKKNPYCNGLIKRPFSHLVVQLRFWYKILLLCLSSLYHIAFAKFLILGISYFPKI